MRTPRAPSGLGLILGLALGLGSGGLAGAQTPAAEIPLDSAWELAGDARVVESAGRQVLEIGSGYGVVPELELEDGTIQVEVQVSSHRAFVFVVFRNADDRNWEEVYLRTHKSGHPDGLQYTPVLGGVSQWQIFHGEGGTAAVDLPAEQWIQVRLEIRGRKLAVFVGDPSEPAMVVARLARDPQAGRIALRSFIPGSSEAPFGARFRNLRISPGRTSYDFDSIPPAAVADPRQITEWQVSPTFAIEDKLYAELPAVDEGAWRSVQAEPDGTVLLDRLPRPDGVRAYGTVARLRFEAASAGTRALDLGFSDAVSVFFNGRPVVSLDQSYRFDRPRVQGVIGLHQSRLYLPAVEGRNELRLVITESFGGWGLTGRWVDADGITVLK